MARNKLTINFKGFNETFEKLDKAGADVKKITEDALVESFNAVTPGIQAAIAPHRDTGQTEDSLVTSPEVKWTGTVGSVDIGFNIPKGGLASIFLMYGTPKHFGGNQYGKHSTQITGIPQDMNLYESVYGTKTRNKVRKIQKKIFDDALKGVLG